VNRIRARLKNWPKLFRYLSRIWILGKRVAITLQFVGAKQIGVDEFENGLLRLNRTTSLGKRGDLVTTPLDKTIFKFVVRHGEWEPQESRFLANRLMTSEARSEGSQRLVFVDIGANSGLVSRQVLNLSGSNCDLVLVEPIPNHVNAIKANLKNSGCDNQISIIEAALGASTGELEISIENSNRGNSSFLPSAMPASGIRKMIVKTLAVEDFFQTYLSNFDKFIIKSDTQGYDSKILSLLPQEFWDKCGGAVIEIWALPEIEPVPVQNLLKMWSGYSNYNWAPNSSAPTTIKEIETFWLSKSGKSRNLFLNGIK
jgi:FkbM family methyltransferase